MEFSVGTTSFAKSRKKANSCTLPSSLSQCSKSESSSVRLDSTIAVLGHNHLLSCTFHGKEWREGVLSLYVIMHYKSAPNTRGRLRGRNRVNSFCHFPCPDWDNYSFTVSVLLSRRSSKKEHTIAPISICDELSPPKVVIQNQIPQQASDIFCSI